MHSTHSTHYSTHTTTIKNLFLHLKAVQHRLVVRHADSLQICALFNCTGVIAYTEWSPCERFVLCAGWSRSTNKSEGGGSLSGGLTAEGGGWCQLFEVVDGATTPTSGLATTGKNANPWQGKIEEGAVGMVRAMWYGRALCFCATLKFQSMLPLEHICMSRTPDGRHVLTWSEFQVFSAWP